VSNVSQLIHQSGPGSSCALNLLIYINNNNNRFMALCPGLPGWAGNRRNTHPPSCSSSNLYQLLPSTTIHSILPVQIMCLSVFLHNLSPRPLWSTSWSGALHLIFNTFLHPIKSSFRNTCVVFLWISQLLTYLLGVLYSSACMKQFKTSTTCENASCKLSLTLNRTVIDQWRDRRRSCVHAGAWWRTLWTRSDMNVHLYDSSEHFMELSM